MQPHAQHQPFSAQDAHALMLDLAGGAAAATLMIVLTCWMLSLGGAFAPGHDSIHGASHGTGASAQPAAPGPAH